MHKCKYLLIQVYFHACPCSPFSFAKCSSRFTVRLSLLMQWRVRCLSPGGVFMEVIKGECVLIPPQHENRPHSRYDKVCVCACV